MASAVAKQEQQQKQWLHVLLHASIFEIQISILGLTATDRKMDRPYKIRSRQKVSFSCLRMYHVFVTLQLIIYSFAVADFAFPQSFYLTKV